MRNIKRCALVMAIVIFAGLFSNFPVYATDGINNEVELTPEEQKQKEEEEKQKEMERVYQLPVQTNQLKNWPAGPATYGEASIVMDIESRAILYAKNIDEKHYPASITKLLTTLVALENASLEDRVLVTESCINFLEWDYAQIGLKADEDISMEQALYATLLASANEAAYAVAANVGDGYEWFIERMNQRAVELGAVDSHFVNPHGLHDDNHYTTARDMALISSELYKYPAAFEMMQTMEYEIPATNMNEDSRYVQQKHHLLNPEYDSYYQYAIGGKTGYTGQALNTLVTYADNGEMHLVCVEMKTLSGKICEDTVNMFEYAFQSFHHVSIAENDKSGDIESVDNNGYVVLPEGVAFDDLESVITENPDDAARGTIAYTYEGQPVGTASIVLSESYKEAGKPRVKPVIEPKEEAVESPEQSGNAGRKAVVAFIVCGAIIMIILLVAYRRYRRKSMGISGK